MVDENPFLLVVDVVIVDFNVVVRVVLVEGIVVDLDLLVFLFFWILFFVVVDSFGFWCL